MKRVERLPFVYFVEAKDDEEAAKVPLDRIHRILGDLHQDFDRDFVRPAKLTLREGHGYFGMVILKNGKSYRDHLKSAGSGSLGSVAHYNPIERLAVTFRFSDADRKKLGATISIEQVIRHEFVHVLQHAYSKNLRFLPKPAWYNEGLAEYLGFPRPIDFKKGEAKSILDRFTKKLESAAGRRALQPLEDLVDVEGYNEILSKNARRGRSVKLDPASMRLFYDESLLFMDFLMSDATQPSRKALQDYAGLVHRGVDGPEAFKKAFAKTSYPALESKFLGHVAQLAGRKPSAFDGSRLGDGRTVGRASSPGGAVLDQAFQAPAPFAITRLIAPQRVKVLRLQQALALASMGRMADALKSLKNAQSPRLMRERRRVTAIMKTRQEHFGALVGTKKRLSLRVGDQRVKGRLLELKSDGLQLEKDQFVKFADLGARGLAMAMRKSMAGDKAWQRDYLDLLSKRRPKKIDAGGGITEDLESIWEITNAKDGRTDLAQAFGSNQPTVAEAQERLTALGRAFGKSKDLGLGLAPDRVLEYAKFLAMSAFDPTSPESMGLQGKIESVGEDRYRFRYDFDKAEEFNDFHFSPYCGSVLWEQKSEWATRGKKPIRIHEAALELCGGSCAMWALPLEAPFRLAYTVDFKPRGNSDRFNGWLYFGAGFSDNGDGRFFFNSQLSQLTSVSGFRIANRSQTERASIDLERFYRVEIEVDAKRRVKVSLDGRQIVDRNAGTLMAGRIFFIQESDVAARLDEMVIEGRIMKSGLAWVRKVWVEKKLASLGLVADQSRK